MFSMMLVQASERRSSTGTAQAGNGEDLVEALQDAGGDASGASCSRRRARFLASARSALSASSSSHACATALRTLACKGLARRSVMLRVDLWTWQRWIGVWRPKVLRIALDSALAPSMMNRRQTAGSQATPCRPGCRRRSACTTAVFSVAPSITPRGCLSPLKHRSCRRRPAASSRSSIVDAVNLDDQQVQDWTGRPPSIVSCAPPTTPRQPARYRRLGHPRSLRRGHVALRQADGAAELARRDVDQHQVERPLAQQVLRQRRLPSSARVTSSPWRARTRGRSISTLPLSWKPTFPVVLPQRCQVPSVSAAVAGDRTPVVASSSSMLAESRPACLAGLVRQKRSKLAPTSCQASSIDCRRDNSSRCGRFLHGVAFLSLDSAPRAYRLKAEQRLLHIFNRDRDISLGIASHPDRPWPCCQRRSKSTPLAGVKMHHLMRFSPALAVVPVVHRRDPRCFV